MGLIPWVLRVDAVEATEAAGAAANHWPDSRSLLESMGGNAQTVLGNPDAGLLLVIDGVPSADPGTAAGQGAAAGGKAVAGNESVAAVLEPEEAQLLQLMMRAIALTHGDVAQCALKPEALAANTAHSGNGISHDTNDGTLASAVTPARRAVIWLQRSCPVVENPLQEHRCPQEAFSEVPMWRVPHPAELLQHPERKREAWEVLKLVARQIHEPGAMGGAGGRVAESSATIDSAGTHDEQVARNGRSATGRRGKVGDVI